MPVGAFRLLLVVEGWGLGERALVGIMGLVPGLVEGRVESRRSGLLYELA